MRSLTVLEHRPEVLWQRVGPLRERHEAGEPLTGEQAQAVLEVYFRVGVHPDTAPATALDLLERAQRMDAVNPRYPYHIGLLFLRRGQHEPALRWLEAAAALSPVNHRIWAHLSLAYLELDERRRGVAGYGGEYRDKAKSIAEGIRAGRDNPGAAGEAGVRPLVRPGVNRWTGIRDIESDILLRARTTERTRDALFAELDGMAAAADHRQGAAAAFTVLAVQAVVFGYPTAAVRRLAIRLGSDGPAVALLLRVCELFEADLDELPALLARCLAERSVPDALIALIHRQRLLWRPLRFPDPGGHAAARVFVDGDPVRHEKALATAWRSLSVPPPEVLADLQDPEDDTTARSAESTGPEEQLAGFEESASGLKALREETKALLSWLSKSRVEDEAGYARLAGDEAVLSDVIGRLEALRRARHEGLQPLKNADTADRVADFAAYQRRLDGTEAELQEPLGSLTKMLNRGVRTKLAVPPYQGTVVAAPSAEALDLAQRVSELERPSEPAQARSAGQPTGQSTGEATELVRLEKVAEGLTVLMRDAVTHARELSSAPIETAEAHARARGDDGILTALAEGWEGIRQARLADLQRLLQVEPSDVGMAFVEYQRRLEECQAALQASAGSLRKILDKRLRPRMGKDRAFDDVPPAPSPEARALEQRFGQLMEAASASDPSSAAPERKQPSANWERTPPTTPPAGVSAGERVRYALDAAEQALDANFAEAWQSLEVYPPELRRREAVVLLRTYVGGLQAESDHRLGRAKAARRRWNTMLADDPLHSGVLRNLAVAHTSAGNVAAAAQAWKRSLEALYLRDLLRGDIRNGASERAATHRVLAASFGTAPLCAGLIPSDDRDAQDRQIPHILASRSKVAIATAHLALEELNHILTQSSPTSLLGVERTVDEAGLAAARERRGALVQTATSALPPRVRHAFEKACLHVFDEAQTEASKAKGRLRRPGDAAEVETRQEWARGRVQWKAAIRNAVADPDAEWALTEYSGDVIGSFRIIDALALDPTDASTLEAARRMGAQRDPVGAVAELNGLTQTAANIALSRIFAAAQAAASGDGAREFPERFRGVCRSWVRNDVPEMHVDALDDASRLYSPQMREAVEIANNTSPASGDDRERAAVLAALPGLERWVEQLPGATGPSLTLAYLLSWLERHDAAYQVLIQARGAAFHGRGERNVAVAIAECDIHRGQYTEAVRQIGELLGDQTDENDQQKQPQRLRNLLLAAYSHWINSGRDIPDPARIAGEFARWTDDETVEQRRKLEVNAALARNRGSGENAPEEPVIGALTEIYTRDPGNTEALYQLVGSESRRLWNLRTQMRGAAGLRRQTLAQTLANVRDECIRHVELLLPRLKGERRKEVEDFLEKLRP